MICLYLFNLRRIKKLKLKNLFLNLILLFNWIIPCLMKKFRMNWIDVYPKPWQSFCGDALFDFSSVAGAVGMLVVAQDARTLFPGDVVLQMNVGEVAPVRYGRHLPFRSHRIRSLKSCSNNNLIYYHLFSIYSSLNINYYTNKRWIIYFNSI